MIIRRVSKQILEKSPYEEWNAFIDLLAMEKHAELNEIQRVAHLSFWYDSEVQNGGHLQYFENKSMEDIHETIAALKELGAIKQANIIKDAYGQYASKKRKKILDVFTFVRAANEGEYENFDNQYYDCVPTVTALLEKYLMVNRDHFIEII